MADSALDLAGLLRELGFDTTPAFERARAALVEARLTNPHKTRVDATKRPRIEELLRSRFLVTCGSPACAQHSVGREVLVAGEVVRCWICAGSSNLRSVQTADEAFRRAGIRRIVVVGGSPAVHDELRQLAPKGWELRLVSGTERRTSDQARSDVKWADLVMIWGSSQLDHKVSMLYSHAPEAKGITVLLNRRGIAALLDEATKHAASRAR